MEEKKKNSSMETTTLTAVPMEERKPWWSIAFIWAGSVICIPALMVGSMVTAGMGFGQAALCMVIGYVIVVFYMCLLGIQSSDLGLPCTVSISRAYGVRGSSFLVSLIRAQGKVDVYDLMSQLSRTYGCHVESKDKLTYKVKNTEVYYDRFLDRLYTNADLYYQELDEM